MARREDGNAHDRVGRVLDRCFSFRKGGRTKGVEVFEEARLPLQGCDKRVVATIERIARVGASKG